MLSARGSDSLVASCVALCGILAAAIVPASADGFGFGAYRATVEGEISYESAVTSTRPCDEVGSASLVASFRSARPTPLGLSYASTPGERGLRWFTGWGRFGPMPAPTLKGSVRFEDATAVPPADADCELPPRSCGPAALGRRAQATLTGLRGRHLAIGARELLDHPLAEGDPWRPYCPVAGFVDFHRFAGLAKDRFGTTAVRFTLSPKRLHVCSPPGRKIVLRARDAPAGTVARGSRTVTGAATRRVKLTLVKMRERHEVRAACRRGDIRYPWQRR